MFNCHKLYIDNRLYLITKTESEAEAIIRIFKESFSFKESSYKIVPSYIENIGF